MAITILPPPPPLFCSDTISKNKVTRTIWASSMIIVPSCITKVMMIWFTLRMTDFDGKMNGAMKLRIMDQLFMVNTQLIMFPHQETHSLRTAIWPWSRKIRIIRCWIIGKKVEVSLRLFDIFEKNMVFIFLWKSLRTHPAYAEENALFSCRDPEEGSDFFILM